MFFDVSKAFDTVCHERLLCKLERLGISGPALKLIRSYLADTRQVYRFRDSLSGPQHISMGVVQSSNLGPLLFSVFINDLLPNVDKVFASHVN